jgi:formylglycine-generating enzyme required for sulfatase activity
MRASEDNTLRSLVTRTFARVSVDPGILLDRLRIEPDVSVRRALLVAIGDYAPADLTSVSRATLASLVQTWSLDADAGVHGAITWLANRGHAPVMARTAAVSTAREWFMTAEGQTLSVFRGNQARRIRMGSPLDEPGRQAAPDAAAEPQHTVLIPRAFAIGATEVTRAEFQRFLDSTPEAASRHQYVDASGRMTEVLSRFGPDHDGPAIAITWYEAAMYCNWLSAREGLPASEWVYPPGFLADGAALPANYVQRTGYRLPTEPEWEFAARAGTATARFFGSEPSMLPAFGWFAANPPRTKNDPVDPSDPQRTMRVGQLRPNDFGLFDVYGNVWEWTQDRVERYQTAVVSEDREDHVLIVRDSDARTRRGGAYSYEAAMARSAARGTLTSLPTNRRDNVGLRIARTLKD